MRDMDILSKTDEIKMALSKGPICVCDCRQCNTFEHKDGKCGDLLASDALALITALQAKVAQLSEVAEKNEPLTLKQLLEMGGEPGWCSETQCYGIIKVDKIGRWANKPFFAGVWHSNGVATNFEWDIEKRGLTIYRRKPEEGAVLP